MGGCAVRASACAVRASAWRPLQEAKRIDVDSARCAGAPRANELEKEAYGDGRIVEQEVRMHRSRPEADSTRHVALARRMRTERVSVRVRVCVQTFHLAGG